LTGKSNNTWMLTDAIKNRQLKKMMQTPIIRHTIIKHNASPYDVTLEEYFKMRDKKFNDKTMSQDNLDKKYARAACRGSDTYSS
jgi:hypothetical protein